MVPSSTSALTPKKGGDRLHSFQAILFCQNYCQDWDTQLEFFKSRACCFAHPGDPTSYSDLICPSQIEISVRQSPGHNANDIGVTSGRREHELSAAPHVERRTRPLERLWQTQALDCIIVTAESRRLFTEESCNHLDSLFQASNAFFRAGKRNTRLRILPAK